MRQQNTPFTNPPFSHPIQSFKSHRHRSLKLSKSTHTLYPQTHSSPFHPSLLSLDFTLDRTSSLQCFTNSKTTKVAPKTRYFSNASTMFLLLSIFSIYDFLSPPSNINPTTQTTLQSIPFGQTDNAGPAARPKTKSPTPRSTRP
jgi:hypothetical protein